MTTVCDVSDMFNKSLFGLQTLNLDVLLAIMNILPIESLSSMAQTCKVLRAAGIPLLIQRHCTDFYNSSLIAFLRFLLVDPATRAPHLRTLVMTEDIWGLLSFQCDFSFHSPEAAELPGMLEKILVHAQGLKRLEVDRCEWLFASATLMNVITGGCRSLTHLDLSTKPIWNVTSFVRCLNCPLQSFTVYIEEPESPDSEITLPLDTLAHFTDTLERLKVIGARLISSRTVGSKLLWPRVHTLSCRTEQSLPLLATSFPNAQVFSFMFCTNFPGAVVQQDLAHDTCWSNLDVLILPPPAFTQAPRCPVRLLSAWIPSNYLAMYELIGLLNHIVPLVLDISLGPDIPPPILEQVLQATRRLKCLRLIPWDNLQDDAAAPVIVRIMSKMNATIPDALAVDESLW
jgi:hypothetical protein